MAQFQTNLDLNKNELRNARVQNLATAPGTPVAGQIYYSTADNNLYVYNGTSFVALQQGTTSVSDATTTSKGIIQLAGDLAGTAASPQIAAGVIVNADVNAAAAIAYSKLNLAGSLVNADIATGAAIALSKLATDPLARANHTGTQLAASISDFNTQVRTSRLDQMAAPTVAVSLNAQKLTNLATPTVDTDAATKGYADALKSGLDIKDSVRAATTASIANLANASVTIDGVTLVAGDRVLVKNGASPDGVVAVSDIYNGIYVVGTVTTGTAPFTRATDADASAEVTAGLYTFVSQGTAHADSGWVLTTDDPITLGTTALVFTQFSGAGQITAGAGLTKTGNTLDVGGTANRISVAADAIDISMAYVGQTSITTLGTITTGTWTGTDIAVADGGTGASTAAAARTNLGIGGYAQAVGDGVATSYTVTHNLGTKDVTVQVYDNVNSPYAQVFADVEHTTTAALTLRFGSAPAANQYRVVIHAIG